MARTRPLLVDRSQGCAMVANESPTESFESAGQDSGRGEPLRPPQGKTPAEY
jgi:hypothetical protein